MAGSSHGKSLELQLKVDPCGWKVVGNGWGVGIGKWSLAPMWTGMCGEQDNSDIGDG